MMTSGSVITNFTEVEYIDNSLSDLLVVNAARVSFNKRHDEFIPEKDTGLINFLMKHKHWSPFAHPHGTVRLPMDHLELRDLVTNKTLMAGLTIGKEDIFGNCLVTGSLYALLQLSQFLDDTMLVRTLVTNAPVSTDAFFDVNGIPVGKDYAVDVEGYPLIDFLKEEEHPQSVHTVLVKAPVFVARQLVKHQVGMVWNEVSRRYVDNDIQFYLPTEWRGVAKDKKQGSSLDLVRQLEGYGDYVDVLEDSLDWYEGNDAICPEQRRMILPQSMMTEWYWTGTLESWNRVFNLRLAKDTQAETREVVQQIADVIYTQGE